MTTADFHVEISAGDQQGYRVSVRSPQGEAVSTMRLPEPELASLLVRLPDAVLASSAQVRRAVTADEQPVRQLGELLFRTLFADAGGALLLASRSRTHERQRPIRLVLRVEPPELARLPWEFLYDSGQGGYLCLSMPLVRYTALPLPAGRLAVTPPLRVLCMIVSTAGQPIDTDQERDRMEQALARLVSERRVELGFVSGQTWRALETALLDPWHAFHFIGHGGFDAARGEGILRLVSEDGRDAPLGADDLATLLRRQPSMRLAVLNACETGRSAPGDLFSSVAGALTRQATPAVLGMQYPISDPAAIEFSRSFYHALSRGQSVDAAVTLARQNVRLAIRDTLEWGTPVLYLRALDGHLFEIDSPPAGTVPRPRSGPAPGPQVPPVPTTDRVPTAASVPAPTSERQPEPSRQSLHPRHLESVDLPYRVRAVHAGDELLFAVAASDTDLAITDYRGRVLRNITESDRARVLTYPPGVAFSPEGTRLVTGGWDRHARIWDVRDGGLIRTMPHKQRISAVAFSADGNLIATGSYGWVARIWDSRSGALRLEIPTIKSNLLPGDVHRVAFSPTGDLLAIATHDGHVMLYDLTTGERASGDLAIDAGTEPGKVTARVDSVAVGAAPYVPGPGEATTTLAYHPRGTHLAVAMTGRDGYLWEISSERSSMRFHHTGGSSDRTVHAAAFSHDGGLLASGAMDRSVRIWDVASGELLLTAAHTAAIDCLAFTPDDRRLVIAGGRRAQIWQLREESP